MTHYKRLSTLLSMAAKFRNEGLMKVFGKEKSGLIMRPPNIYCQSFLLKCFYGCAQPFCALFELFRLCEGEACAHEIKS